MALATNERTGSINHDVYNRHVFTDPSNMMMNLGLEGMGQATRAPTLPDIRDFVDAQQHRDALNHGQACSMQLHPFALILCAGCIQQAYLVASPRRASPHAVNRQVPWCHQPARHLFFEMDGLAGLHHSRRRSGRPAFRKEL